MVNHCISKNDFERNSGEKCFKFLGIKKSGTYISVRHFNWHLKLSLYKFKQNFQNKFNQYYQSKFIRKNYPFCRIEILKVIKNMAKTKFYS